MFVYNSDYKSLLEYALKEKRLSYATIEKYNAQSLIKEYKSSQIAYVYFDLETSPLYPTQKITDSSIIEIGALCRHNLYEFEMLCNPGHKICNSNIHHISNEMVFDKISTQCCVTRFIGWLDSLVNDGLIVLIAHNGSGFDKHVLGNHLIKYNINCKNSICIADTRYILGNYYKELKSKSLESLYKHIFSETYIEKHRALDDVKDLQKLCEHTMLKNGINIEKFIEGNLYLLKIA